MAPPTPGFQFPLERLLSPISPEFPAGELLRYEGTYDRIREARREDDASLSQGVWKTTLKKADWDQVERLCLEALEHQTKDLQIAAWLLEAWLHLHGFSGLREGLLIYAGLCRTFPEDIHPQIEDGDLEYRAAPINWINEKLPDQIKLLPLTQPASDETPGFTWADWEMACRPLPSTPSGKAAAAEAKDRVTQAKFQTSASLTPTPMLMEVLADVNGSLDACSALETALDQAWGRSAPSLRQLWGILDSIRGLVVSLLNQRDSTILSPDQATSPEAPVEGGDSVAALGLAPDAASAGPRKIRSRAEAYQFLAEAADYLARTEPHSPTPYLIRRAINWGGMTLEELLGELVRDRGQLQELFRLLQVGRQE